MDNTDSGSEMIRATWEAAREITEREGKNMPPEIESRAAAGLLGNGGTEQPSLLDPDPFTIGIGIFGIISGGAAFLESRRQRQFMENRQREAFRAAWFAARRSLVHFRQVIDEFETLVLEDGYGTTAFRIGAVHLTVDRRRHDAMKRLKGQALITANRLADEMDELSDYLSAETDQTTITAIMQQLTQVQWPNSYGELITIARQAFDAYQRLLDEVGARENFVGQH